MESRYITFCIVAASIYEILYPHFSIKDILKDNENLIVNEKRSNEADEENYIVNEEEIKF